MNCNGFHTIQTYNDTLIIFRVGLQWLGEG